MSRDRHLEDYLLDLIHDTTLAGHGIDTTGLASAVRERLAAGDLTFGPDAHFDDRDLIAEAREEAEDLVAYVLLEVEVIHDACGRLDLHVIDELITAAVATATAYHHLALAHRHLKAARP